MKNYYRDLKPILNKLTSYNVFENLYTIRQYMKAFSKSKGYANLDKIENSENAIIQASLTDFLVESSLIYCTDLPSARFNLSKSNDRALLIRELNKVHDKIDKDILGNENPFLWLKSAVFNQEKEWFVDIDELLYRYYSVYNKPTILDKIQDNIGLPYKEFIYCSLWLYQKFEDAFCCRVEELLFAEDYHTNTILSKENIDKTLKVLSLEYDELKSLCKQEIVYDEASIFNYHNAPHLRFPIMKYNGLLYCVNPQYILNQATKGMYHIAKVYECNEDYGKAFEGYIGTIIKEYLKDNHGVEVLPEQTYNKGQDKSSDWIIADKKNIIFIECKTKKPTAISKEQLQIDENVINEVINGNDFSRDEIKRIIKSLDEGLEKDIIILGIGVGKMYKACYDYRNNLIESLPFDPSKTINSIFVTSEEWLPKIPEIENNIRNVAKGYLSYKNIDEKIFEQNKPEIISAQKMHAYIQIMGKIGISEFFRIKDCKEFEERKKSINYDVVRKLFEQEFVLLKD